jgi:hypothetical protein
VSIVFLDLMANKQCINIIKFNLKYTDSNYIYIYIEYLIFFNTT